MSRIRIKNFSPEPVQFDLLQTWRFPGGSDFVQIVEKHIMGPGEVTQEFDPDDPYVQRMLKVHPELRAYVGPTVWERLRKPEF